MAALDDAQKALLVHFRLHGVHLPAQPGLGKGQIHLAQYPKPLQDILAIGGAKGGKLREDPLDLLFLLPQELFIFVAQLHHRRGLDEQSGPAAGLIVDQAGDVLPVFLLHRQHEAAVADGNQGLLQILLEGGGTDHIPQPFPHPVVGDAHTPPDPQQGRGSPVADLLLPGDAPADLLLDAPMGLEPLGQIPQQGAILGGLQRLLAQTDRLQAPCDAQ